MNRLPQDIETHIWQMSGVYRDQFTPVLQQIRMIRLRKDIAVNASCDHTCSNSKECPSYVYWRKDCDLPCMSSDCCDFGAYYKKKCQAIWEFHNREWLAWYCEQTKDLRILF